MELREERIDEDEKEKNKECEYAGKGNGKNFILHADNLLVQCVIGV
jgi:hypothetical protein